jgi:hypothetical protein
MGAENAVKPRPDAGLLTPNDLRRLRVALDGRDPGELLGGGDTADTFQVLILAYKLRDDPTYTWEQAGDVPPGSMFDMSGGDEMPPPPTPPPGPPGSSARPSGGSGSRKKRAGSVPAPSSAPTTASPGTSSTT